MNLTPRPGAGEFFVTRTDLRSRRQDSKTVLHSKQTKVSPADPSFHDGAPNAWRP